MLIARLLFRNVWRHRARAVLTLLGLVVATLAFGLLSTVVSAWYAGAEGASNARLITRNAISLVFPLPMSHGDRLRQIDGVVGISWANWFGGIYKEPRNFFPQFAVDPPSYLAAYPEYMVSDEDRDRFFRDRRSVLIGRKIATTHGLQVGGTLVRLDLHHPQPRSIDMMLSAVSDESMLGDEESSISLNYADHATINAEILTANGTVILS